MARYTINGIEMPGVTTILGMLDKSNALMGWAVKCFETFVKTKADKQGDYFVVTDALLTEARYKYKEVSSSAMDIGSQVHDIIEQYIKAKISGKTFDPTEYKEYKAEVENAFLAFLDWEKNNIAEYLESEQPVASTKYFYAGTMDIVAKLKNGFTYLIDIKSSAGFYDEYNLQLAAYKYAREENKTNSTFKCQFKGDDFEFDKDIHQPKITIDKIGILRLDKETGLPEFKDISDKYDQSIVTFIKLLDLYYCSNRRLKGNARVGEWQKAIFS